LVLVSVWQLLRNYAVTTPKAVKKK